MQVISEATERRPQPTYKQTLRLYHETRRVLREHFPKAFPARGEPVIPLKVGIQHDLLRKAEELDLSEREIIVFMRQYCNRPEYTSVISAGGNRLDLDGWPAGPISKKHQQQAASEAAKRVASAAAKAARIAHGNPNSRD